MRTLFLTIITLFLVSCVDPELPTAETMETGDTVAAPRQYEEFCERDVNDICPEDEENDADAN